MHPLGGFVNAKLQIGEDIVPTRRAKKKTLAAAGWGRSGAGTGQSAGRRPSSQGEPTSPVTSLVTSFERTSEFTCVEVQPLKVTPFTWRR